MEKKSYLTSGNLEHLEQKTIFSPADQILQGYG